MTRDIVAVMVTVDRGPKPNYLTPTIYSLERGGLLTSDRLYMLLICDGDDGEWAQDGISLKLSERTSLRVCIPNIGAVEGPLPANKNVAEALECGEYYSSKDGWVLFLEDDIVVCANFFDSVAAWLDKHAREDRRVYAFGCAYPQVEAGFELYKESWNYPIQGFYGTQCFAIRSNDALSLSKYLTAHCYDRNKQGTQYDLLMHDWSKEEYPHIDHFLASCPSFVDHIGMESVINPRANVHTFPSFPGEEWSYV